MIVGQPHHCCHRTSGGSDRGRSAPFEFDVRLVSLAIGFSSIGWTLDMCLPRCMLSAARGNGGGRWPGTARHSFLPAQGVGDLVEDFSVFVEQLHGGEEHEKPDRVGLHDEDLDLQRGGV